jgi:hypothetical protein
MATYIAKAKVLVSHLSRTVEEGDIFDATFPEGFNPEPNLTLVPDVEAPVKVKPNKGE